ncbi:pseudouridylate synthase-like protein [Perkinsela sp. CCAP 1560/4]|nr:pseudouridylate synthase-like protein [Perkinsela sp. CCAP 1560/4]|eukprot:KNH05545.1 pseudouridylate synthase-like protein [Perkinsela sp. CCAP 1560/4]
MRLSLVALLYGGGTVLFFNFGMWQLYRRKWKTRLIELQYNLDQPAIRELPSPGSSVPPLNQKVAIEGRFDYSGSVLVGPRTCPNLTEEKSGIPGQIQSATGSKRWGESQGGFFVFTPFHVASDESLLMVNIGWVPIDACRSETHLRKYLRKTTHTIRTLKGSVKYEEDFRTWWNGYTEACHQQLGVSWPVIRPGEMARDYYQTYQLWRKSQQTIDNSLDDDLFLDEGTEAPRKRDELPQIADQSAPHPYRHYYVTMFDEDDTSRVVIDNEIFPKRCSELYREQYFVTPNTHLQYAIFWFLASAMSARFLKKSMDHAALLGLKKAAEARHMQKANKECKS